MSKFKEELSHQHKSNLLETVEMKLDAESLADFRDALNDNTVPAPAISVALKHLGLEVSENTIRRWRKRQ